MGIDRSALERIAADAGRLALAHFRRVVAERKADRSLVTAADREVEAQLVAALTPLLPDAGIVGEEGTMRAGTGPELVVIDPIDGTAAFVAGLPTWCVCAGILRAGRAVAGVVHLPCTGETFTACDGVAWWNGTPLPRLDETEPLGDPFVVADAKIHRRRHLRYPGKLRSLGSGAYHVVLVARGVAEAALLGHAHVWDLAAPGAILAAVGGVYEYLDGSPVDLTALTDGRRAPAEIIAGSPTRLARLRPVLGDHGFATS